MKYYHPAGRLAWDLRRRAIVPLSLRAARELTERDELTTLSMLDSIALVLPITRQRCGWLADPATRPPWPAPRNPLQRAALVAWTLYAEPLTVRQVAELTGLARNSAYVLLSRLSEVVPIVDDDTLWRAGQQQQPFIWRGIVDEC